MVNKLVLKSTVFGVLAASMPSYAATQISFTIAGSGTTDGNRHYYQVVEDFNKSQTAYKVVPVFAKGWDTVVKEAGDEKNKGNGGLMVPEVASVTELVDEKKVAPLDEFIDKEGKDAFLGRYIPGFLLNSKGADGKTYCLPFIRSIPLLYVNLDAVGKAGYTKDTLPADWAGFETMLEKLKEKGFKQPLGHPKEWDDLLAEQTVLTLGGNLFKDGKVNLDSPEAIETLKMWQRWKNKGLLEKLPTWRAAINGLIAEQFPTTFFSSAGGKTLTSQAKFKWVSLPFPKGKMLAASQGGGSVCMSSGLSPEQAKGAWEFLKFMGSADQQANVSAATGFYPVVKGAFERSQIASYFAKDEIKRPVQYLESVKQRLMVKNIDQIRNLMKAAIEKVVVNGEDAEKVLKATQAEAVTLSK